MNIIETIKWQWEGYENYHRDKGNLLIHIIAIPLSYLSVVLVAFAILRLSLLAAAASPVCFLISLILQSIGHKREALPPQPFAGKGDFFKRLILEQFINFPRFFFTGGWFKNFMGK